MKNEIKLLTNSSAKLDKSQNETWLNAILYLEPTYNNKVCPFASNGCKKSCLVNSGMMKMPTQTNARLNRTKLYFEDNETFMQILYKEINALIKKANKQNKKLAIRLNGTSDLNFIKVYNDFKDVQFYEYTKRNDLLTKSRSVSNLHLTYSRTENSSNKDIFKAISNGFNVAIVFDDKKELPKKFNGFNVLDGDKSDRRFEDKKGNIIGLKLKGTIATKRIALETGFAI